MSETVTATETVESENLSEMVRNEDPVIPVAVEDLDFGDAVSEPEAAEEVVTGAEVIDMVNTEESDAGIMIATASLRDWISENAVHFENIGLLTLRSDGVDPNEDVVLKCTHSEGGDYEDNPKMKLRLIEYANERPVLNIPGQSMEVFNTGFQIVYDYSDQISIKAYGVKTGLIIVFCSKVADQLIPFATQRLKKKDDSIALIENENAAGIPEQLAAAVDIEEVQILYKQISKYIDDLGETKGDIVTWLIDRQADVTDVNHLLQIDNVIMKTLQ